MVLKESEQPIEIPFRLPMSAANTFTELEINLPVNVNNNLVFDLDRIEFVMAPSFDPIAAGRVFQAWTLCFNTQSALLTWDDSQVIAAFTIEAHASAALLHSGERLAELHNDTTGRANLIARASIFMGINSSNATVLATVEGRLIGSLVKLKPEQLTQLVLNQLT